MTRRLKRRAGGRSSRNTKARQDEETKGGLSQTAEGKRPTLTAAVAGIVLAGGLLFVSPAARIKEVSDAQQQKLPTDAVDGEITEAAEQG